MLSFRRRLALVHLAVIIVVLGVAALSGYWFLARAVHGQLDAALLALAETEVGMLAEGGTQAVRVHEVPPGPAQQSFSFVRLDRLVQVIDAEGTVLARSANLGEAQLPVQLALLDRLSRGETVFETLSDFGEEPVRVVSVPIRVDGALFAVQVAGSLDDVDHVVASAGVLFLGMGVSLVLALGLAGTMLTRRVFGAIDDIVQQARRIGEPSLSRRLPHPGSGDEIGRLVDTLNEMLARLEHSFETQRRFTADASHELRSPLSRLRTELEVTLRRPRNQADYVDALRSCLEEVERLTLTVEELLILARLDAGQERARPETVSLNRIADEAVRRIEPVARERGVHVAVEASSPVSANIGHGPVSLVLANLLDNAVKFSPPGARVSLQLSSEHDEAIVRVADQGPGLNRAELPYLFERFFRGSAGRSDETPGTGLGLALSQAMVQAHGGRIEATNAPSAGAVFTVHLPIAASDPS